MAAASVAPMVAYTFGLKRFAIVNVLAIAAGGLLRAVGDGVAIGVAIRA